MGTRGYTGITSGNFYKDMRVHGNTLGHPGNFYGDTQVTSGNFYRVMGVCGDTGGAWRTPVGTSTRVLGCVGTPQPPRHVRKFGSNGRHGVIGTLGVLGSVGAMGAQGSYRNYNGTWGELWEYKVVEQREDYGGTEGL